MNFKVNYKDLFELGGYVKEKNEEIDDALKKIESIIKTIPTAWKGKDADVFLSKVTGTIEREKKNNERVKTMSVMLKYVSYKYGEEDEEWLNKIKNEVYYNEY